MSLGEHFSAGGAQNNKEIKRNGLSLAVVSNINDPDTLGRVRCKPVSEDPDAETDWCFCLTPAGGDKYGFFFFPQVDDLVVLAYIGGDVHHPLVLGSFWAGDVQAPYQIEKGKNEISSIKTPKGTEIKFDDSEGKEKLIITTPSGAKIHLDDEAKSLAAQDKNGDNALVIKWEAGEIELKAKTKLSLSAGETKIVLESSGSLSGQSAKDLKLKSGNVELKGDASVKAEGAAVDVKASGQLTLQASGVNTIKGSLVKIN